VATGDIDVAQPAGVRPSLAQPAAARPSLALRYARPAVAALVLLVVIAGVGAASPAVTGRGPWYQHSLGLAVGLEIVLAGLEVGLVVMSRRAVTPDHPARALRSALVRTVAVVMVAVAVIGAVNAVGHKGRSLFQRWLDSSRSRHPRRGASARPLHRVAPAAGDHLGYVIYGLIGVVVLAALIYCVIAVVRARIRLRQPGGYLAELAADEPDDLRRAIASGHAALRSVDEARAAIIACYVAMEDSLATAGATRALAETPDELLARAVAAGLIHGPAASTLTGLFYEARFSTHPVAALAKDAASGALDAISAELAGSRASAPAVGMPP
jgi:Domain of unknown function (DUF4129)